MNEPISKTVSVRDVDLHIEVLGDGEPLLLLHGLTGSCRDWDHAGRSVFQKAFRLIMVDARGHGRSTGGSGSLSHRECALDTLALLDRLGLGTCKAIGASFGGNVLLHVATMSPERVAAMVLVSATPYFPEQARRIMGAVPPDAQPPEAWASMRERHHRGDEQIRALFEYQYTLKDSYDDVHFTPPELSRVAARTLLIQGDRDPLYPIELTLEMHRAIPGCALNVVPRAGHLPIFVDRAEAFAHTAVDFLKAV